MADHLFFRNVPAIQFPFIECDLHQLNKLSLYVDTLSELLDQAKRGVASLNLLQARVHNNQVVRCTPQSVKVTAAARYAPSPGGLDLGNIAINSFVGLVTFLPLPDIKTLANNTAALRKSDLLFERKEVNARWGTYYTHLTACNSEWAQRFFQDIQENLKAVDSGANSPTREQPAAPNFHHQINVHYSNPLANLSTSQSITKISQNLSPSSPQASCPPILPPKQNESSYPTDDQISNDIQLYLRALKAKEKAWGPENITTLETINDLGKLYAKQGKVVEAEEMYVRALSGFEKVLGTSHDRTLKVSVDLQELRSLVAGQETRVIQ
ncbi:hypothetical protein BGW36DRAFT_365186 [Talaromyces proteolyticus]|uniref:Kinesin light chain n=1 Tax=Talaromyces proteolyticus TaxID=1131652 RepID=A0AAD4PUH9_9EURO|nr:uncharacterized protein BGW36DRAFT_365186 [Talaromyces proteolyticus]KAH8689417.1 hypothetical protein BGW36DRAFT_365186 [Talaromyces proteolyticus]